MLSSLEIAQAAAYSPDGNEVVGISIWDSAESRDRYRR